MTASLTSLLVPFTKEQIRQRILNGLLAAGFPVSDWAPTAQGGLENGLIDMVAGSLADLGAAKLAASIAGGFLDFGTGAWLTFWASRFYLLERTAATSTIQAITISCVKGAGPYTVQPGELVVIGAGSIEGANRYRSIEGGTIPTGAGTGIVPPVVMNFQAENPGSAYDDIPLSITTLVTSLAGVTVRNARIYSPQPAAIVAGGGSKGVVGAFNTVAGVSPTHDRFRIRIVGSGNAWTAPFARFVFSVNDGATWSASFAASTGLFALGDGCTIYMVDSPTTSPSFVIGDEFFFASTSILQQGSDDESDARLVARCRARWLTLSDVPSSGTVELWAKQASPEVARVKVLADTNAANRLLVYVGSSSGRAAAQTVVDVQTYVTARLDPSEFANVLSVDTRAVAVTGTVQVPRLQLAAIQTQAEKLWTDYLASVDIAGTVRLAELEQAVMDAGSLDYTGLALTGGTPNLYLGTNEVAVPPDGSTLISALVWEPV